MTDTPIATGQEVIKSAQRKLPDTPGVYRMLDEHGKALYVGKAKSLKKRVASYTHFDRLPIRLQRMVAATRSMEFVHTHTEAEALLLESNLIKKLQPRFNVLLRDDKSFPYILMTQDHDFPTLVKHRGARKRKGKYFGPFASAGDVNRTIQILQKAFMLRNCTDSYFAQRTRPCLQYHIKRCTAPCVGKVERDAYAGQVAEAQAFLEGKSQDVQQRLAARMQEASEAQDYEQAAMLRDRIRALTSVQARQHINVKNMGDADVLAMTREAGQSCVQVFFFRGGRNHGNRAYYPRHTDEDAPEAVLAAFIAQFYENKPVPRTILVSEMPEEKGLLAEALSERAGHKVIITKPQRGERRHVMEFAVKNAQAALTRHKAERQSEEKLLAGVADLFALDSPPERIEVYDNSHISGTNMVGAMIVAGPEGFRKNAYRKFNIKKAGEGDDTGMMREVLERRFGRALREGADQDQEHWPDLVIVDGGRGQYNAALAVLEDLGIADQVPLVAIAKGPDRNAGREEFYIGAGNPFRLPPADPVLHYLQRLRDEAHRFAIGTHRSRRSKDIKRSPLDGIPGVGAKRKKALLAHFGSAKAVAAAGLLDLQNVEGISESVARVIYDFFHEKS